MTSYREWNLDKTIETFFENEISRLEENRNFCSKIQRLRIIIIDCFEIFSLILLSFIISRFYSFFPYDFIIIHVLAIISEFIILYRFKIIRK